MKNIIKILLLTVVISITSVSCELNKYPFNAIEQPQAFMTMKDAGSFNNGLYSSLRGVVYGIYMFSTDIQADLLNATLDYGNRNGFAHKWTSLLADDYTIRDTWRYQYNTIANINKVVDNMGKIPIANATEQATMDKYMGEAYLMRAYLYHQLVQRFAKDYEPATASTDLGVPLVLTYDLFNDLFNKPSRATVAEIYQQILADLGQAGTLLSSAPGAQNSPKITSDCVLALKARVYLCMHDWTNATAAANSLITSGTYPLITTAAAYKSMWATDGGTETILQLAAIQPSELGNANNVYLGLNPQTGRFTPDYVPEQWVVDMYPAGDIRKAAYLEQKTVYVMGTVYSNFWLINKYPGNPALFTAASTNYMHKPKIFRIAEVYLISAEAAAQTPATEAAALTTLNLLRTARGEVALAGLTGSALMDAIRAERTRELLCEGFRLDDLKRWKLGFSRSAPQNLALIITGPDFNQKVVAPDDDKFVWGIPANDMTTNPSLIGQQNPGWY